MKIVFCTTPIRPVPTSYPPIAITTLMDHLAKAGYQSSFYDIDALRPKFEDVVAYFAKEQPDLLCISAVVSTAYRYTKEFTNAVKKVSPKTKLVLGGNLAASSEILLRKTPLDVCVIGEGEIVLLNLVKHFERFGDFLPREELSKIKGISFLKNGELIFTGYEAPLPASELPQPNFDILEKYSDITRFIRDPLVNPFFAHDPRTQQPHRKGMKESMVMTAKGCVSRCTFCHRWDKGYRPYLVEDIVEQVKYLKEKHNVGFFCLDAENFGSDRKQVDALIKEIKPLDVLFYVAGIRVSTVDRNSDVIQRLRDAGCVTMIFGMESGSSKILQIMEKGATAEQNATIAKKLSSEGMYTIVQLVLGMPGENDQTIRETIEFAKLATEDMSEIPYERLSVNLFQALPGTPGYEFMRERGMIGNTLEDEEAYLLQISDVDASAWEHYKNISEASPERVALWGQTIIREATINWYKKRGWKPLPVTENMEDGRIKDYARGGYFRILKPGKGQSIYYWWTYDKFRWLIDPFRLFNVRRRLYGLSKAIFLTLRIVPEEDRSHFKVEETKSLRKIVTYQTPEQATSVSEASMIPLRMGR